MNKKHVIIAAVAGVLVGVMFASKIRALPLVGSKIPTF